MAAFKLKSPKIKKKNAKIRQNIDQDFTFAPMKVYVQDPNPGRDPFESSQATDRAKNEEQRQLNKLLKYKLMEIEEAALLDVKDEDKLLTKLQCATKKSFKKQPDNTPISQQYL